MFLLTVTLFSFVVGYVLGFEWNELVNNCFVNLHNGDVYQCMPISIFCRFAKGQVVALEEIIDKDTDVTKIDNVYVKCVLKLLNGIEEEFHREMIHDESNEDKLESSSLDKVSLFEEWKNTVRRLFNIVCYGIDSNSTNVPFSSDLIQSQDNLYHVIQLSQLLFSDSKTLKLNNCLISQYFMNIVFVNSSNDGHDAVS